MRFSLLAAVAALTATVAAHGEVTSPPIRNPGPNMMAACGAPAVAAGTSLLNPHTSIYHFSNKTIQP